MTTRDKALAVLAEAYRLLAEARRRTTDSGTTHRVYRNPDTDEMRIMAWPEVAGHPEWVICWQATGGEPPRSTVTI
jgi:hypothetical protein